MVLVSKMRFKIIRKFFVRTLELAQMSVELKEQGVHKSNFAAIKKWVKLHHTELYERYEAVGWKECNLKSDEVGKWVRKVDHTDDWEEDGHPLKRQADHRTVFVI